MSPVSPASVIEHLSWRTATKKFDPTRKIPADTWATLEKSLLLAPSSYGLQPWMFMVITNPKLRARLREHAHNQPQITDASHLVVLCRRTTLVDADVDRLINRIVAVRGVPREAVAGYRQMMLGTITNPAKQHHLSDWNARQTYIALGMFLTACAMVGVDACPMEGFDSAQFDEILSLPAHGYASTVLAPAGYRAADDPGNTQSKVRFPTEEVIHHIP